MKRKKAGSARIDECGSKEILIKKRKQPIQRTWLCWSGAQTGGGITRLVGNVRNVLKNSMAT